MQTSRLSHSLGIPLLVALGACGGGDTPSHDAAPDRLAAPSELAAGRLSLTRTSPGPNATLSPDASLTQRAAAATATAQSTANACQAIKPFYWEIGDRDARLASGSVLAPGSTQQYTATTPLSIASASKWVWGHYVAQRLQGTLSETDRKFVTMRSGYVNFNGCTPSQTIDSCLRATGNGSYTPEADGRFQYSSGHMQKQASLLGLGELNNRTLATELRARLGSDVSLNFSQPLPAGGLVMSPDAYARLLRKTLRGELQMKALLGTGAVCTNPVTCALAGTAMAPVPPSESWHYSVGHWVEDDPVVGDGAYSSPGAFGFYPWIDASQTVYGVLGRMAPGGAFSSVQCGRLIRKAWLSGVAQ